MAAFQSLPIPQSYHNLTRSIDLKTAALAALTLVGLSFLAELQSQ
jgi:hypothetical protein